MLAEQTYDRCKRKRASDQTGPWENLYEAFPVVRVVREQPTEHHHYELQHDRHDAGFRAATRETRRQDSETC